MISKQPIIITKKTIGSLLGGHYKATSLKTGRCLPLPYYYNAARGWEKKKSFFKIYVLPNKCSLYEPGVTLYLLYEDTDLSLIHI